MDELEDTFNCLFDMGKFVLNGATGNLGNHAANYALEIVSPNDELVFTSSKPEDFSAEIRKKCEAKGVPLIYASYDDVPSLEKAFQDAEAITLISTFFIGDTRRRQHKACIDAAVKVGVKRVCYTSFIGAGLEKDLPFLPQDHKYTEELIYASGLEYNIQRNYLYGDNIYQLFAPAWKWCGKKWYNNSTGVPAAFVTREDCGRVLAALLFGKGEPNTVYNVSGPEAISDNIIRDVICKEEGVEIEVIKMTDEELYKYWAQYDLPDNVFGDFSKTPMVLCCHDLVSCGETVRRGLMSEVTDTVEKLTGHKPQSVLTLMPKYKKDLEAAWTKWSQ